MEDNKSSEFIDIYIGISFQKNQESPSLCFEFPISMKIFLLSILLSELEKNCDICNGDENSKDDIN